MNSAGNELPDKIVHEYLTTGRTMHVCTAATAKNKLSFTVTVIDVGNPDNAVMQCAGVLPLPLVEGTGGRVAVQLSPDVNPPVPQVYVRLPLYPAEHVNTSVLPYACDAACVAVPPVLAEFEGTATALVRPSHAFSQTQKALPPCT